MAAVHEATVATAEKLAAAGVVALCSRALVELEITEVVLADYIAAAAGVATGTMVMTQAVLVAAGGALAPGRAHCFPVLVTMVATAIRTEAALAIQMVEAREIQTAQSPRFSRGVACFGVRWASSGRKISEA